MAGNTGDGTIAVFSVGSNGLLTHVPGSPFQTEGDPLDMKVTPDNRFLVIASHFGGVEVYAISPTGSLSAISGSPFIRDGARAPLKLDIRCDGKILVEGLAGYGKEINVFDISVTGQLSPIPGSPFQLNVSASPALGRLTFDERFFFADHIDFAPVLVFNVAPDGYPTLIQGGGASLLMDYSLTVITNRNSNTAYFGNFGGNIIVSAHIDQSGALVPAGLTLPITTSGGGTPALAIFPAKTCGSGSQFDYCLQDESNGTILQVNLTTGAYDFTNCRGVTLSGIGSILKKGCYVTLQVNGPDRRVLARIDTCAQTGTSSIQVFSLGTTFTILDRNTANNSCFCANS